MNCEECRRQLQMQADPFSPPDEAALHLALCNRCQAWHERLKCIETNVLRLPVPESKRKAEVLRFFLKPPVQGAPAPSYATETEPPARTVVPIRPWLKRWSVAAAAAAILIATGIWLGNWAAQNLRRDGPIAKKSDAPEKKDDDKDKDAKKEKPATKALAALLLECDLELAETSDPARRVQALARLARGLQEESPHLAKASADKELATLARLYDKVLSGGVVPRAKAVPMAERREALQPIAEQLALSRESMKSLASKVNASVAPAVERIATAADTAARKLQELMDEAS